MYMKDTMQIIITSTSNEIVALVRNKTAAVISLPEESRMTSV